MSKAESLPMPRRPLVSKRPRKLIVADSSVFINLIATDRFDEISQALDATFVATPAVWSEVARDPRTGIRIPGLLASFEQTASCVRGILSPTAAELSVEHIGAQSPDNLDDVGAQAIAYAVQESCGMALDERRTRRVAAARYPRIPLLSSLEVFQQPELAETLGLDLLRICVVEALQRGRMYVAPEHETWLWLLVGEAELARCPGVRRPSR